MRYENTIDVLRTLFRIWAASGPIVLDVDDLQWIDDESIQALESICLGLGELPWMVLATSRYAEDGSRPELSLERSVSGIELRPLGREKIQELLGYALEGEVDTGVVELLEKQTQGNPFFIRQALLYFQEEDVLIQDPDTSVWSVNREAKRIPPTIRDLLVARIDKLPTQLKKLIRVASVLGQDFRIKVLAEIAKETNVDFLLKEGQRENIWVSLSDLRYVFTHSLMKDAIYHMQLKAELRETHRQVAETIEKLFPEDENVYADLAFHYRHTDRIEKKLEFLEKSGKNEEKHYRNQHAIECFELFLKLVPRREDSIPVKDWLASAIGVQHKLGGVRELIGDWKQAQEGYELALEWAKSTEDLAVIQDSVGKLAVLLRKQGYYNEAIELFDLQNTYSQACEHIEGQYLALSGLGAVHWRKKELQCAMDYYQRAFAFVEALQEPKYTARAHTQIGQVYERKGMFPEALVEFNSALQIHKSYENRRGIAQCHNNLGILSFRMGDFSKAMGYYQVYLRMSEELGDKWGLSAAYGNMGVMYREMGQLKEAIAHLKKDLRLKTELHDQHSMALLSMNIAQTYRRMNALDSALDFLTEAIRLGEILELRYLASYWQERAEILYALEDFSASQKAAQTAKTLSKGDDSDTEIHFRAVLFEVMSDSKNKPDKALAALEELKERADEPFYKAMLSAAFWEVSGNDVFRREALEQFEALEKQNASRSYILWNQFLQRRSNDQAI